MNILYIYSIIQEKGLRTFLFPGLEDARVYTLNYKDIAAVVSSCSIADFDELDGEALKKCLVAHQRVNETLVRYADVVPMAFGMTARREGEVMDILSRAYLQFVSALKRIGNRFEFAVQVYWDEAKVLKELVASNCALLEMKEQMLAGGKSGDTAAKIKFGELAAETLTLYRGELTDEIEKSLKRCAEDIKRIKLTDDSMIANLALLVDKSREKSLDCQMEGLGKRYADTLQFKYIGPLAPASFTSVNIKIGNFDLLSTARQTLGVGEESYLSEIKDAYLALARKYHPDRHAYKNDPEILEEMTRKMREIQDAYEILAAYCKTNVNFSPQAVFSLRKEDVEKSLLVEEY